MKVVKGYKQTDVGVIPEDWEVQKLGDVSNVVRGGSPRPAGDPKYFNGKFIPWLTVASLTNISNSEIFVSSTESHLTEAGSKHSRTLQEGTLIIANSGATLGVAKIIAMKCCANDGIAVLMDIKKNIDSRYIVYYINTKTKHLREVIATGNGQPNLNTDLIGNIQIPLPPTKAEQTAIANALFETDELISTLEKLIAKKQNIKQGTMQVLLTGKKRLKGFNDEWETRKLGEVADISKGKQINKDELTSNDIFPVINGGIEPSGYTDKYNTKENTITISEGGNSCGYVNYLTQKFWSGGHCYTIQKIEKDIAEKYLYHLLKFKEKQIMELRVGSGLPNIQKNRLADFSLSIPALREQESISEILTDIDAEIKSLQKQLSKYKMMKEGMMQNLLTGKIRLG